MSETKKAFTLARLAQYIKADIVGPYGSSVTDREIVGLTVVKGLGSLDTATEGYLSHLSGASYRPMLPTTQASAVILSPEDAPNCPVPSLVVSQPYLAFARISQLFEDLDRFLPGIHPSAVIAGDAIVDDSAHVGAHVVIESGVRVAARTIIQANCSIGQDSEIGSGCRIFPNVSIYPNVRLGEACTVHSGAVLGADGFGFTPDEKGHFETIAQLGGLSIGDNVSIGAGTTIDCGAIDDTVIGAGVKIDNLVQIGHNCKIGDHSLICGSVGLAGSTQIGRRCVLAGGSGVGGKHPVKICDQVVISVKTTVTQSIDKPGVYSGSTIATDHATWLRNATRFTVLNDLFRRVKKLEGNTP